MVDIQHKNITGADAAHPPFYASESDPTTTLGAYRGWFKPSTGEAWIRNAANTDWVALTGTGGGSGGHTIQEEGSSMTTRTNLNFTGAGVTVSDDSANDQTDVVIPGGTADPASETIAGIAELATQTEVNAGTDTERIVTPATLAGRTATETRAGIAEIATQTETNTGTDDARIVTSAKLAGRTATDTRAGIVELATQSETDIGTDTTRVITPATLANYSGLGGGGGGPALTGYTVSNGTTDKTYDADSTSMDELADVLGTVITDLQVGGGGGGGSSYRTLVTLGSDVANSTPSTNSDVTGLSFAVTSGTTYRFEALISFNVNATATGTAWGMNGPAFSHLALWLTWPSAISTVVNQFVQAYDGSSTSATSAATTGNICTIRGIVTPSASGTLVVRFQPESGGTVTARAGSTLEYW